jgi:hypothetical protein
MFLRGDREVRRRTAEVQKLLFAVCGEEEFPWFVSDEATLFDVCSLEEREIGEAIAQAYGTSVDSEQLRLPIWRLVDELLATR